MNQNAVQGRFCASKGFTLIELLVVVLIIGILAAVAVPQYQKAVLKSRYSHLKISAESLYRARKIHYLETGNYGSQLEDFSFLHGKIVGNGLSVFYGAACSIESSYTYCRTENIAYYITNEGKRACLRYDEHKLRKQICESETGRVSDTSDEQVYWY